MGYNQSELVLALVIDRNLLPSPRCYNLSVLDHPEVSVQKCKGSTQRSHPLLRMYFGISTTGTSQ